MPSVTRSSTSESLPTGHLPLGAEAPIELGTDDPRDWRVLDREVDRLKSSEPRAALVLAERWLGAAPAGEAHAWALRAHSHALRFTGQYDAAHAQYAEAERALADLGLPDEVARSRIGHVDALRYLGEYEAAIALARDNLAYFRSRGSAFELEAAKQTLNVGLVYWRRGDLQEALACARQAQTAFARLGEVELEAVSSMNTGLVLADLGQYGEALRAGEEAARRFRSLGLRERLATVQMNLGLLHARRGEYARALQALEASRALCEELGLDQKRAAVDLDLVRTYLALNLNDEAAEACARAVATLRHRDQPFELAHALVKSAQAAERRGDVAAARVDIAEAGRLFARVGSPVWKANTDVEAARLAGRAVDVTLAERALPGARAAAARLEELGAQDHAATAHLVLGGIEACAGRKEAALVSYERAEAIGHQLHADEVLCLVHTARGVLIEPTAPEEALASFRQAAGHLERLRAQARADDLKMSVVAGQVDLYERIAGLLLREATDKRRRDAFHWLERGRSRGLLEDALAASERGASASTRGVRRARERVRDLRGRLNAAYGEHYASDRPAARAASPASQVERLEGELAQATRQLQITLRTDRALDVAPMLTVDRVQAAVPPGACLLEYAWLGEELVCFVVRRDGFEVRRGFGSREAIDEAARWFWFHIRKGVYGPEFLRSNQGALARGLERSLQRLGELLLAPLADALAVADHAVIVPHGSLHTLPFHAFLHGEVSLLDRLTVSYAPSAGLFVTSAQRGDRRFDRPVVVAPDLPDLPWIVDEAERVGGLFPGGVVLTQKRATRAALRRHARRGDALHLATHGVFRADNPTFSAVQLADGWLSVGELAELGGDHALVTLSACHTGMSGVGPGDELLGLTRAVLGGGTAALLASLWAVNDDSTAALMTRFYDGVRRGRGRAASLREAALAIRDDDPHPYFWAPFILVGAP